MSEDTVDTTSQKDSADNVIPLKRADVDGRSRGQDPEQDKATEFAGESLGFASIQAAIDLNRGFSEEIAQSILARRPDFEFFHESAKKAFNVEEEKQRIEAEGLSGDELQQKLGDLDIAVKGYAIMALAQDLTLKEEAFPEDPYVSKMAELQKEYEAALVEEEAVKLYEVFKKCVDEYNPRSRRSSEEVRIAEKALHDYPKLPHAIYWKCIGLLAKCFVLSTANMMKSLKDGIPYYDEESAESQKPREEENFEAGQHEDLSTFGKFIEVRAQQLLASQSTTPPVNELKSAA